MDKYLFFVGLTKYCINNNMCKFNYIITFNLDEQEKTKKEFIKTLDKISSMPTALRLCTFSIIFISV